MRHAFEAALDAVARSEVPSASPQRPFPSLNLDSVAAQPGGHSLWDFAAAWTPEADPPPTPEPPPRPSQRADDIARELDLSRLRSAADIAHARRRFMWDNHPDRRADLDAALANSRVAIANMLLDGALARLGGRWRR